MSNHTSVLIIGGGSIGERHLRCFLATERAHVALCEINETLRDQLAHRYDLSAQYASLEAALRDPPEVAVVATPAQLHVAMAMDLINAGCHVLIEKPLSISTEGIDRLRTIADERRRTVGLAYVLRHNACLQGLREALRQGTLGRPLEVVYSGGQDFARLRPAYREIYYRDRATGGGAIQDALTHMVNAVEWLVGPATRVAADAAHLHLDGVEVEDTVHAIARHGDVLASYVLNQHQAPNEGTLSIHCEGGSIRFESHENHWMTMRRGETQWEVQGQGPTSRDAGFQAQAQAFLDAVAGQGPLHCTLEEGAQTLSACLALLKASESGQWVDVD
jgi:predicted dehydrogenase